ncbi:hypothetical protein MTO98_12850 [Mucilaginibacter sp. SMC90]|uniref:hypothetical protein n=1 Tax=Mucilaginibacter sp. SMC90 TaxID=2929803 RepID=UPI001FB279ED|nr:hypothetical protein [Mucilaginibacter sp. SMC90]UOE51969.1 hypothetical protein MTO98_12850 [Mucilaginibacter sp. SMC90]
MKLFYHFLVLVAASLVLIACANLFASTPEEKLNNPAQRSGINLDNDSLYNSEINTRLIFSDMHHYDALSRHTTSNLQPEKKLYKPFKKLLVAADYAGLNQNEK